MQPDPRFPDRPTHPDFDILSEAVCANDDLSDLGPDSWRARTESYVDLDSLTYMAMQRVQRMIAKRGAPETMVDLVASMAAAEFDGFIAGVVFAQLKAERNDKGGE